MNKKISIYELLGLIKDGKAPEKIRYNNTEWNLIRNERYQSFDYQSEDYTNGCLFDGYSIDHCSYIKRLLISSLNDEVEIIEEDKKIQYLHYHNSDNKLEYNGRMYTMRVIDKALVEKLDELVDEVNKLKEKE